MQQFTVDEKSDGKSLIRVILAHFPGLTAGQVYQALRRKDIRQNGQRRKDDGPVAVGDVIAVYLPDDVLSGVTGQDSARPAVAVPYQIIYEDPLLLIVSKQPGITVHNAGGEKEQGPFLIDLLRANLQEPGLTLCHRLDRQTGGLLIVARRPVALQAVQDLMRAGLLSKRYRCLVRGVPDRGQPVMVADGTPFLEITGWLEKDSAHSDVYIHDIKEPGDLSIITRYRVLRVFTAVGPDQDDIAELEVELVTGRTHQIRAHFAHYGYPLLGDGKYGRNSFNKFFRGPAGPLRRQQLYSTQLIFSPECKGPLAYLAGRTFAIEPEYDIQITDKREV